MGIDSFVQNRMQPPEAQECDATYRLTHEKDAIEFAMSCEHAAYELGIDSYKASLFRLACSELAMNAVRHAGGGSAVLYLTDNRLGIAAEIHDAGPGISNIKAAQTDGFSTYGSLGLGLGVAQRSADRMQLETSAQGTSIRVEQYPETPLDIVDHAQWCFSPSGTRQCQSHIQIRDFAGDGLWVEFLAGPNLPKQHPRDQTDPYDDCRTSFNKLKALYPSFNAILTLRLSGNRIDCLAQGDFKIYSATATAWSRPRQNEAVEQLVITSPRTPDLKLSNLARTPSSFAFGKKIIQSVDPLTDCVDFAVLTLNKNSCKKTVFYYENN